LQIAGADVLEAGLVDELFAIGLGVAELQGIGDVVGIGGLRGRENWLARMFVRFDGLKV
jgi:hypothetical protein